MKQILVLIAALAVVAAFQYYLFLQQSARLESMQSKSALVLADGRRQIEAIGGKIDTLGERMTGAERSIGLMKSEYASAREAQFRELRTALDNALKTHSDADLAALRDQVDQAINNGALFQDRALLAAQAAAMADAARNSDPRRAAVYYLSAVNHAPSELHYLEAYTELVMSIPDARPDDLARLRSVLQVSVYQVPPESIGKVLELVEQATQRESQLLAQQLPPAEAVDWSAKLTDLNVAGAIASWKDTKSLGDLRRQLHEIAAVLEEEQPGSELAKRAGSELDLVQRVSVASVLAARIGSMIESLQSALEGGTTGGAHARTASLMQTIEAMQGQLWAIDRQDFPADLTERIDSLPAAVQDALEKPALGRIDNILAEAKPISRPELTAEPDGSLQELARRTEDLAKEAMEQSRFIASATGRDKVEDALRAIHNNLAEIKRWQFDAYQKWAIGKTKAAYDEFENVTWIPMLTDKNVVVLDIFNAQQLARINRSVLSPEVGAAFDDVMRKLLNKVDGKTAFDIQTLSADPPSGSSKISLEDF